LDTTTFTPEANSLRGVVERRRSVRLFTEEPVPEAVIRDCLEQAILAPNSSNLQTWEFYWVRDGEKKKRLADACLGQNAATSAQEMIVIVARLKTWRRHCRDILARWPDENMHKSTRFYYEKLAPFVYTLGPFGLLGYFKKALTFCVGFFRPILREPFTRAEMKVWAVKSAALASENLMLAVTAHGYDSCPMEGFDKVRVRRLLKLPRDAQIVMVLGVGKCAEKGIYFSRFRFELDEVLHIV